MESRKKAGIFMILVAVALAAAALIWGGTRPISESGTPVDTGNTDTTPPAVSQDVIDVLTVSTATVECTDIVGAENVATAGDQQVVRINVGALKSVPPRKWSDALSTPLDPHSRKAVQRAICMDPLLGSTTANMLAHLKVGGVSVLSLNGWLEPYAGKPSKINNIAAQYVPQLDGVVGDEAIAANVAWQGQAELINTLLGRFKSQGVKTLKSVKNYHLTNGGISTGGLPNIGLDPRQDKRSALILAVTAKNSKACSLKIGFNLGDKRPEVFGCPQPSAPGASVPSTPGSPGTPGTPSTPGTTPSPEPSTPGSTPTPTPSTSPTPSPTPSSTCPPDKPYGKPPACKDTPASDPQSKGNVPPAGTKTTPSVDNSAEVNQPATQPTDGGNGIAPGQTPRATVTPAPAPTAPAAGPGPTTLPAPTEPATPASQVPTTTPIPSTGADF